MLLRACGCKKPAAGAERGAAQRLARRATERAGANINTVHSARIGVASIRGRSAHPQKVHRCRLGLSRKGVEMSVDRDLEGGTETGRAGYSIEPERKIPHIRRSSPPDPPTFFQAGSASGSASPTLRIWQFKGACPPRLLHVLWYIATARTYLSLGASTVSRITLTRAQSLPTSLLPRHSTSPRLVPAAVPQRPTSRHIRNSSAPAVSGKRATRTRNSSPAGCLIEPGTIEISPSNEMTGPRPLIDW